MGRSNPWSDGADRVEVRREGGFLILANQKRLYAHVELASGHEIRGEIDSLYTLSHAADLLSSCGEEAVVLIGDYIAVRAGEFVSAYAAYENPEDV